MLMAKKVKTASNISDQPGLPDSDLRKKNTGGIKGKITLSDDQIRQIEILAGLGLKMSDISLTLGFSERTLYNKSEEDERVLLAIKSGMAKAASQITQTAFQLAKSGKYPAMTMFWLKCRQRWREVHAEEMKSSQEIIFKTKIGEKGQIMSEQVEAKPDEEHGLNG